MRMSMWFIFIIGMIVIGGIVALLNKNSNKRKMPVKNFDVNEYYAKKGRKSEIERNDVKLNKNLSRYDDDFYNR